MTDSGDNSGDIFQLERLRKLVELMQEFDLRELDLMQADQQIRLCRGVDQQAPVQQFPPPSPAPVQLASIVGPQNADSPSIVYIKSPMVGTFYSRTNPKAEPFAKVGDYVEPEKTVCVIEAMKVFNEIPAEVRGRIVAVLVEDEEPVEFGKPLFKIDTSG